LKPHETRGRIAWVRAAVGGGRVLIWWGADDGADATSLSGDPRTDEQRAADQAAADAAILRLTDFPNGWEALRRDDDDDDGPDLDDELAECLEVDVALFNEATVSSKSDTFVLVDDGPSRSACTRLSRYPHAPIGSSALEPVLLFDRHATIRDGEHTIERPGCK
jgi:hypothetical protein